MGKHRELICPKDCPDLDKNSCNRYGNVKLEENGWMKENIKCFACRNQTNTGDKNNV